jgi:hypothetical protein
MTCTTSKSVPKKIKDFFSYWLIIVVYCLLFVVYLLLFIVYSVRARFGERSSSESAERFETS